MDAMGDNHDSSHSRHSSSFNCAAVHPNPSVSPLSTPSSRANADSVHVDLPLRCFISAAT
eukprot:429451-Rhodomonas_salina.1